MFRSISDLYPLDANSFHPIVTTESISRNCHVSTGKQCQLCLRPTDLLICSSSVSVSFSFIKSLVA